MNYVKAPDFPTGGTIYGYDGVRNAFETGKGRIVLRAKTSFEEVDGRDCIIVTEIPYMVNKADMIKKTADLVNDKKIEGISDIEMNLTEMVCESFIFLNVMLFQISFLISFINILHFKTHFL